MIIIFTCKFDCKKEEENVVRQWIVISRVSRAPVLQKGQQNYNKKVI